MRDAEGVELGKVGKWRHAVAGVSVVGASVLGFTGVVGQPDLPEKFEHKQVVVQPAGTDGVRIREVVDQDFGTEDRHGYERIIPNDFGIATDVTASSPDAPAGVSIAQVSGGTRIRIGDPNRTITGQHRYVLTYTLPDARLSAGELALDIIGTEEPFRTDTFEVIVTGMQLADPLCNVGRAGTSGGCDLVRDGDEYRTTISPLLPKQGITIGGTITARTPPADIAPPPLPVRRTDDRAPVGLAMLPMGLAGAGGVYLLMRRRGRNEVFAGGAADAAFGKLAPPGSGAAAPPVRMVADTGMDELATIEFAPPKGLEPWQGSALLREKVDDETVKAWLSGAVAKEAIALDESGKKVTLAYGPHRERLTPAEAARLAEMLGGSDSITLGTYDPAFSKGWKALRQEQQTAVSAAGWWKSGGPGATAAAGAGGGVLVVLFFAAWFVGPSRLLGWLFGFAGSVPVALLVGLLVPAVVASAVYAFMLPARTAVGSALALQAESFRRFLAASEGRHVDWAWEHGLLREYSAWAVALGAADAWNKALQTSHVPPAERSTLTPLIVPRIGPAISSTRTAPSSSSSGGSSFGGFSGGSVGGGGGGGSSGSW